jgi:type IV pilus assembly protein PilN
MPRINLLPWREQQRTDRKKAFGVGLGAAGLAALVLAGLAYLFFGQMIDAQQARNERLRAEIQTLDKQIEQINSFEQQKQQNLARMQIIEKLQQSRPEIVHVFDTFTKIIPDGIYLTSLEQKDQRFKIVGLAQTPARVSPFLETIEASEWLKEAELEQIERKAVGHEFTMYANQRTAAADDAGVASTANSTEPRNTP